MRQEIIMLQDKMKPMDENTGTCIHYGAGLFRTALHVLKIELPESCTLDEIRLTIRAFLEQS